MISFFNRLGNSWVAKGIFFLLGLSMMAFWGLGGVSNTSISDGTALKVGKNKVSMQEVSRTFDQERNKMAKISGGYMTPKRAIQAGLLDQVVQQLVMRELNAQVQDELGLVASDEAVRRYIEKSAIFADNLGKFDANLFYAYLSGMNLSQAEFAQQLRAELANQHLVRSVSAMVPQNKELMKKVALAKKEKREIVSVLLTLEQMPVSKPTEQELKDYYEAYQEEFGIPEYRTIRVVSFTSKDFKGENAYNQMYALSRQLEDLLGAGKSLQDSATELKLNAGQVLTIDAVGQEKSGKKMPDNLKPLLTEVFALSEGESSSLIEIENGFMVAGVEKVIPQGYKAYATVRGEVEQLWQREQRKTALTKTVDDLVSSVQQGKGWKGYTPTTQIISQTESARLSKTVVPSLLSQKIGLENVASFSTEKGMLIAYTKRTIPSKEMPTETEMQEAMKDWNDDLLRAVQQGFAQKYPVDVHTDAIQKSFSIYDSQED